MDWALVWATPARSVKVNAGVFFRCTHTQAWFQCSFTANTLMHACGVVSLQTHWFKPAMHTGNTLMHTLNSFSLQTLSCMSEMPCRAHTIMHVFNALSLQTRWYMPAMFFTVDTLRSLHEKAVKWSWCGRRFGRSSWGNCMPLVWKHLMSFGTGLLQIFVFWQIWQNIHVCQWMECFFSFALVRICIRPSTDPCAIADLAGFYASLFCIPLNEALYSQATKMHCCRFCRTLCA